MKKGTMQALADTVKVSRITVWKALNGKPGVSDELRQRIKALASEMGLAEEPSAQATPCPTYSLVVARPDSAVFWMQIIHTLAKEMARGGGNLMYTYMPTAWHEGYTLPAALTDGSLSGIAVLNIYDARLQSMLSALNVPKVFLDSLPLRDENAYRALGGDLVLIEGRSTVRCITRRLLDKGYTRLGFAGDVRYAQTNTDRWQGFLDAHAERGVAVDPSLCLTGPIGLKTHEQEILAYIKRMDELPQAIVCASDFIAAHIRQALTALNRTPPEGFLLTGFDNAQEYPAVAGQITTVDVRTPFLGKTLASKLLYRASYPDAPLETTYVQTDILWRGGLEEK